MVQRREVGCTSSPTLARARGAAAPSVRVSWVCRARRAALPSGLALALLLAASASAQTTAPRAAHELRPPKAWTAIFGGAGADSIQDVIPAAHGGYFAVGVTHSFGQGQADGWVARVDARGVSVWERAIGGPQADELRSVAATPDGGCVLAGWTRSFGAGGSDGWVVKLAADGAVELQHTYGTGRDERFESIALVQGSAPVPGYYVGGAMDSIEGDEDIWVLGLDPFGAPVWQEVFSGSKDDDLSALTATPGGVVLVANSNSGFGVPGPEVPFFRPWILSLDGSGQSLWQRTFNVSGGDALHDVQALPGGGLVLTGEVLAMAFYRGDVWVMRLDAQGNLVWNTYIGDNLQTFFVDTGRKVRATPSGGFLVAASTATAGQGSEDAWVLRLNSAGDLVQDRTLGGSGFDNALALAVSPTGEAIVGGFVQAPHLGSLDAFLTRIGPDVSAPEHASCWSPAETGPNVWAVAPDGGSPSVQPAPTSVVPVASAARVTVLASGSFGCP